MMTPLGEAIFSRLEVWPWDLNQPHRFSFFFDFPDETTARTAAAKLSEFGVHAEVYPPELREGTGDNRWVSIGLISLVPAQHTVESLNELGRQIGETALTSAGDLYS